MKRIEKYNFSPKGTFGVKELLNSNGNWRIVYVYNNWGSNIMMILPNFGVPMEDKLNEAVMEIGNSTFELAGLVDQFIKEFPNMPFLIVDDDIVQCSKILEERLAAYGGDFDKFIDDSDEFDKWRQAVYQCTVEDGDSLAITAFHDGWRYILEEGSNE